MLDLLGSIKPVDAAHRMINDQLAVPNQSTPPGSVPPPLFE